MKRQRAALSWLCSPAWSTVGRRTVKEQRYSTGVSRGAPLRRSQKQMMEDIAARWRQPAWRRRRSATWRTAVGARTGDQDFKLVLKLLVEDERAVKVKPDLYYAPEPVEISRAKR